MAGGKLAAIFSRKQEYRTPVEGGVEADGEFEGARAANREAAEEAEKGGAGEIFPAFVRLEKIMKRTKADGDQDSGRPKTDAIRESAEQVRAEKEFFGEADSECLDQPPKNSMNKRTAVDGQADNAVAVKNSDESYQKRNSQKAPE